MIMMHLSTQFYFIWAISKYYGETNFYKMKLFPRFLFITSKNSKQQSLLR